MPAIRIKEPIDTPCEQLGPLKEGQAAMQPWYTFSLDAAIIKLPPPTTTLSVSVVTAIGALHPALGTSEWWD